MTKAVDIEPRDLKARKSIHAGIIALDNDIEVDDMGEYFYG